MEEMKLPVNIKIIRSARRTISARLVDDVLIIRAPRAMKDDEIADFIYRHRRWLQNQIEKSGRRESEKEAAREAGLLTDEEIRALGEQAAREIPPRVRYYAQKMGVTYGRITIRCQKTRWGSCSGKGNLNFNCLLMLCPQDVIDSVVVHELAHRKEMNHSARFYSEVYKVYPEYDRCHAWLKENGSLLLRRAGLT